MGLIWFGKQGGVADAAAPPNAPIQNESSVFLFEKVHYVVGICLSESWLFIQDKSARMVLGRSALGLVRCLGDFEAGSARSSFVTVAFALQDVECSSQTERWLSCFWTPVIRYFAVLACRYHLAVCGDLGVISGAGDNRACTASGESDAGA